MYALDLDWTGKVVQSCVHCHQVGDAIRLSFRENKQPIPIEWIYPQPAPEAIGLTLATDQIAHIDAVAPGSPAAQAGIRAGDDLTTLGGQPLLSIADVSWALNRAPEHGTLAAVVLRGGKAEAASLTLPAGWRSKADISRRVGTWPLRGLAFGGLKLDDLADDARAGRGLDTKAMALNVTGVGQYGKHAAAKNAGFQKDDLIVGIDGLDRRLTESELLGHLLQNHPIGDKVPVTVLRGSQRVTLTLPMQ
jgi:S1-C subfamily serine protease